VKTSLKLFSLSLLGSIRDLAPIVLVIAFFEVAVLHQMPEHFGQILLGLVFVVLGLTFFIFGLEQGLFPIGESMAHAFASKGSIFWLALFSFALGFGTTVAEPALIAIANKAASIAAQGGHIQNTEQAMQNYADGLRYTVATSVGIAIVLGVIRILFNWSIQYMIMTGYMIVVVVTAFAPDEIIGIAYDSGGVTTSTITVPLVTALGIGLASSIKGRNPMLDGFGLIAFASLLPIIFVLVYGILV
jgi:hypothetical protein